MTSEQGLSHFKYKKLIGILFFSLSSSSLLLLLLLLLLSLVNTSTMIQSLRTSTPGVKQVWPADDSAGGGRIVPLYNWYNHLSQERKENMVI